MPLPEPKEDKSHARHRQPRKSADQSSHLRGQHSIEYIILLTLIMAGIIIMGRYVVRSWNANLEGWQDSAEDSLTDTFPESPPVTFPGCDANDWQDAGCGGSTANICTGTDFDCDSTERLWKRPFTHDGCQCAILGAGGVPTPPEFLKCTPDDNCCTAPEWTGECDGDADQPPGNTDPACISQMDAPKNADDTCPDGYGEAWVHCGDEAPCYGCIQDQDGPCSVSCQTPPFIGTPPHYLEDGYCPGAFSFVPEGRVIRFVDFGQCSGEKCEYQCGPDFWAIGNPPNVCASCGVLGINKKLECNPGEFDFGGCPSPAFKPCCHQQ